MIESMYMVRTLDNQKYLQYNKKKNITFNVTAIIIPIASSDAKHNKTEVLQENMQMKCR